MLFLFAIAIAQKPLRIIIISGREDKTIKFWRII